MAVKKLCGKHLYKCRKCGSIYSSDLDPEHFTPFKCCVCKEYKYKSNEDLWYTDILMKLLPPVT